MSKSMYNVQNPDDLVARYGADTLRLYEMFLGPVEQAKPWDTNGIEGVHRFLKKFWKLYDSNIDNQTSSKAALKVLHQTIKKIGDRRLFHPSASFSFASSAMMAHSILLRKSSQPYLYIPLTESVAW